MTADEIRQRTQACGTVLQPAASLGAPKCVRTLKGAARVRAHLEALPADVRQHRHRHRPGDFQAIRGVVRGGQATWQVAPVRTSSDLTIHQVGALLPQVESDTARARVQRASLGPEVRPGFLTAVAEIVDRTTSVRPADGSSRDAAGPPVPYVFGQRQFEVRVRSFALVASPRRELTGGARVADVAFEIRTLATGERTRFEMIYPLEGALAGVPLRIKWQPRWWLQVELQLDEDARG
jgi:hypothetical protein